MSRYLLTIILFYAVVNANAQSEPVPSSATDSKVKIHTGKRIRATAPRQNDRALFREKKSKAVNVSEREPKVQTTNKRKQKRNNRFRQSGK